MSRLPTTYLFTLYKVLNKSKQILEKRRNSTKHFQKPAQPFSNLQFRREKSQTQKIRIQESGGEKMAAITDLHTVPIEGVEREQRLCAGANYQRQRVGASVVTAQTVLLSLRPV